MPNVRTKCPSCEIVIVDAGSMTLRRRNDAAHAECTFVCPDCVRPVVQPLSAKMVPVLIGAGCNIAAWDGESNVMTTVVGIDEFVAGQITEDEISEFCAALQGDDWFAQLAH